MAVKPGRVFSDPPIGLARVKIMGVLISQSKPLKCDTHCSYLKQDTKAYDSSSLFTGYAAIIQNRI